MTQILQVQSNSEASPSLVCRFLKSDSSDRWEHQWLLRETDSERLILSSVEGDNDSIWPPSPPFQDLSKEDLGHTVAVMGVGMAGKSHWSVAVSEEENCLVADFACLVKEAPQFLGSSWQLYADVVQVDGSTVELNVGETNVKFLVRESSNSASLKVSDNQLVISAISQAAEIRSKGTSVRWSFEASIQPPLS